jgi:electron transport complex protein RnfG
MNKILKLALVLFVICAIVAGVLGGVDLITRDRIKAYQTNKTNQARAAVLPVKAAEGEEMYIDIDLKTLTNPTTVTANGQDVEILSAAQAADGSGYVVEVKFSGAQGNVVMIVGVSNELTCTGISITQHSETPGLGAVAAGDTDKGVRFRDSFIGVDGSVQLKDIDAMSGATITSKGVTAGTAAAIQFVDAMLQAK